MSKVQRAFLIVVGLVVGGAVPFARATAASSVLGPTVCLRVGLNGGQAVGIEYTTAGVQNISGAPVDILCTLFRDNTTNTNGMQDLELAITDPSTAAGGFICDAVSQDRTGNAKKVVRRTNTGVGNQVLDWGGSVNVSVSKGHYAVRCTVPNGATLRSIYYLEP
jgi:hypothetical protein